jgi:flagellar basal-body rod modification protein FlgD
VEIPKDYLYDPLQIKAKEALDKRKIGKEAFLELLVTELRHQDPFNPVDNKEFITQLATFNSLEQLITLNQNVENLNKKESILQGASLISKKVVTIENVEGRVVSVSVSSDGLMLHLDNGATVNLEEVKEVKE